MSVYEGMLISKILSTKDFYAHKKFNITSDDFVGYKEVYTYIENYLKENVDSFPSVDIISEKFENFDYEPDISDSFKAISKELKAQTAKREMYQLLQNEVSKQFEKLDGHKFTSWIEEQVTQIKKRTDFSTSNGTDWASNGRERYDKYKNTKKNGKIVIPTPYETLNNFLEGGNELGDYVLLQGYTNTGKSWIASDFGLAGWENSFGVLHYSPELSKSQQEIRLDVLKGGFKASDLSNGSIDSDERIKAYYERFIDNETRYIIKSMEDIPNSFDLDLIEQDLDNNPDIKMVIIDGFNLIAHKGSGSNRDKMATTSRRLRQIFSRYNVVGLVVHQTPTSARKENLELDDEGFRLPAPAKIHQYSETIAVVQDACTVLSWDASRGLGKILIAKARKPCVDEEVDILLDYSKGSIMDKNFAVEQFDYGF